MNSNNSSFIDLIPPRVFERFFYGVMTEPELALMNSLPQELVVMPGKDRQYTDALCVLYFHPKITADEFLNLFDVTSRLAKNTAACAAVISGRIDILELTIENAGKQEWYLILEFQGFKLLCLAAEFIAFDKLKLLTLPYDHLYTKMGRECEEAFFLSITERDHFDEKFFNYVLAVITTSFSGEEEVAVLDDFYRKYTQKAILIAAERGNEANFKELMAFYQRGLNSVEMARNQLNLGASSQNDFLFHQELFVNALKSANKNIIKLTLENHSLKTQEEMVCFNEYDAFRQASKNGDMRTIIFLFNRFPEHLLSMIRVKNYEGFLGAVENNHPRVADYILEQVSFDERCLMIRADCYNAFRCAARGGNITTFKCFIKLLPKSEVTQMMNSIGSMIFAGAAGSGNQVFFQFLLEEFFSKNIKKMIEANRFLAFESAVHKGHANIIEQLIQLYDLNKVPEMVASEDIEALVRTAIRGDITLLKYLVELTPKKVILETTPSAFRMVIKWNNQHGQRLELIDYFVSLVGVQLITQILREENYAIFESYYQDLSALKRLISLFSRREQVTIARKLFLVIEGAEKETMEYVVSLIPPKELNEFLMLNGIIALQNAVLSNDSECLRYLTGLITTDCVIKLEEWLDLLLLACQLVSPVNVHYLLGCINADDLEAVIQYNDFLCFKTAALEGNLGAVKLVYSSAEEPIKKMLRSLEGTALISDVYNNGHRSIAKFLLSIQESANQPAVLHCLK